MIISRTPHRISFFGGGTDYPGWYTRHGGAVLATTIDKYCYISCRHLPPFFDHKFRIVYSKIENTQQVNEIVHPSVKAVLQWLKCETGLEVHHDGDVPARSGLGSSSSFTVGLLNAMMALSGRHVSKEELAQLAIHVEQNLIKENVGSQDQVSAAFGGFNRIEFLTDGSFQVSPVVLHADMREALQARLMLVYTGVSRIASEVAKSTIDNLDSRAAELRRMSELVNEAMTVLLQPVNGVENFGRLLHEAWQVKRKVSDRISTSEIDDIYRTARDAGAIGGKLLGAGGGGFVLLFAPPDAQQNIREKLGKLLHVPFRFETSGSRIVLYQPQGLT